MSDQEKIAVFERIQKELWRVAMDETGLIAQLMASLIRAWNVPGPDGQPPEEAG